MLNKKIITIDIIRHGECEGGRIFRGTTDVPLSTEGWENMVSALTRVNSQYHTVMSSPLKRCKTIAAIFAAQHQCTLHVDDDLRELFFGDWEGIEIDTIWEKHQSQVDAWYRNPAENAPPNGETTQEFYTRVTNAFSRALKLCDSLPEKNPHGLFVVHAGVIRMLLANIMKIPLHAVHSMTVPYANMSRIKAHKVDNGFFLQLEAHNIHLGQAF